MSEENRRGWRWKVAASANLFLGNWSEEATFEVARAGAVCSMKITGRAGILNPDGGKDFRELLVGAWIGRTQLCTETLSAEDGSFALDVPQRCYAPRDPIRLTAGGLETCVEVVFESGGRIRGRALGTGGALSVTTRGSRPVDLMSGSGLVEDELGVWMIGEGGKGTHLYSAVHLGVTQTCIGFTSAGAHLTPPRRSAFVKRRRAVPVLPCGTGRRRGDPAARKRSSCGHFKPRLFPRALGQSS